MKAEISQATYEAIAARAPDVSAFLEAAATDALRNQTVPAAMPEHVSIDRLAAEQRVSPIIDYRTLKADFLPPGETTAEFLEAIDAATTERPVAF